MALIIPYLKSIVISFTYGGDETSYVFGRKGCMYRRWTRQT